MGPALWLALARDELRAAELLGEHGIAPLACFHADQAVEKALWAFHLHRAAGEARSMGRAGEGENSPPSSPGFAFASAPDRGARRPGIAAALASLGRRSARRPAGSEEAEADRARAAVQVAQELIERVTERVYG